MTKTYQHEYRCPTCGDPVGYQTRLGDKPDGESWEYDDDQCGFCDNDDDDEQELDEE